VSFRINRAARTRSRRAFTLIELLVVIAIIATLAAVVAPAVLGNVGEARRASVQSQLEILALALDSYRLDNDEYPDSNQGLDALRNMPLGGTPPKNWKGPYLRQAVPIDPWGRPYVYSAPGIANPSAYDLYSLGKDGNKGGAGENADITSWRGPVP
jgi:general secretion pathway protein G